MSYSCKKSTDEKEEIKSILNSNDVKYFYHFTHRDNLEGIKEIGYLIPRNGFSDDKNNGKFPRTGGNELSYNLDERRRVNGHSLGDYVHLSFCENHPMMHTGGKNPKDYVVLKIRSYVAQWPSAIFSDRNALKGDCKIGGLEVLRNIDFSLFKKSYFDLSDELKSKYQAEIMIDKLPTSVIVNLNDLLDDLRKK